MSVGRYCRRYRQRGYRTDPVLIRYPPAAILARADTDGAETASAHTARADTGARYQRCRYWVADTDCPDTGWLIPPVPIPDADTALADARRGRLIVIKRYSSAAMEYIVRHARTRDVPEIRRLID